MNTTTIESLLEAMEQWRQAETVLSKAHNDYDGYSFGWAYSDEIDDERNARKEFESAMQGYATQQVDSRLRELGLIPESSEED
jgi:hypothetical protein